MCSQMYRQQITGVDLVCSPWSLLTEVHTMADTLLLVMELVSFSMEGNTMLASNKRSPKSSM